MFQEHTGRVFRLQFDEFQIVSSSHDDTILIWDFLNYKAPPASALGGSSSNQDQMAAPAPASPMLHDDEDLPEDEGAEWTTFVSWGWNLPADSTIVALR